MANNSSKNCSISKGPSTMRGNSALGSMYLAFDDYEKQARQRKFVIAEYEVTVENLEKELKETTEKNKSLEAECEKLQIVVQVAEANYEKKVKEKELKQNGFQVLSKEMDEVTVEITKKKKQLKEVKEFHQQKLDQIKKTEEKFMREYMKNPGIARYFEVSKKGEELEDIFKEKIKELERRKQKHRELRKNYAHEWEAFKKKCVKLAEMRTELVKKLATRETLKTEYEKTFKVPTGIPVRRNRQIQETPILSGQALRSPLVSLSNFPHGGNKQGSDLGRDFSRQRRSSTFQQLDRLLYRSPAFAGASGDRRISPMAENNSWRNLCSPIQSGSTLVSQIKSKLKGTVHPMPRNQPAQGDHLSSSQTPNENLIATINPTPVRNDTLETTSLPVPVELVTLSPPTNERRDLNENLQETASNIYPGPYGPHENLQSIAVEQMETNKDDSRTRALTIDQPSPKLSQSKDVEIVDEILAEPTPHSFNISQQASSSIDTSQSPDEGGLAGFFGGFGSTPTSSHSAGMHFFDGFFGSDTSQTSSKSPEFPFMFS